MLLDEAERDMNWCDVTVWLRSDVNASGELALMFSDDVTDRSSRSEMTSSYDGGSRGIFSVVMGTVVTSFSFESSLPLLWTTGITFVTSFSVCLLCMTSSTASFSVGLTSSFAFSASLLFVRLFSIMTSFCVTFGSGSMISWGVSPFTF